MQPSDLLLTVDIQNLRLVAFNGTPSVLPPLFQSNTKSLRVICVNPGTSTIPQAASQQYVAQSMAGFTMRAIITPTPTGTAGGPAALTLQPAMTWDPVNAWFFGDLPLNTTEIDTYIGSLPSRTANFELTLMPGHTTVLQIQGNLSAVGDEGLSFVPVPSDQYFTAAASDERYVRRLGLPGQTQIFVSPSGLRSTEIGLDDNGNFFAKVIS